MLYAIPPSLLKNSFTEELVGILSVSSIIYFEYPISIDLIKHSSSYYHLKY